MKKCKDCPVILTVDNAYLNKDGYFDPRCKSCQKARYANYYKNNKEQRSVSMKAYYNDREQNDVCFRLAQSLRARLRMALKRDTKVGSTIQDLGCSIEELKQHLESKFQSGMTWENRGKNGWHIDHVMPLSKFDLTDRVEFLKACNYTNLQPLWWQDNLSKGNR
jgi:hypothetical protein